MSVDVKVEVFLVCDGCGRRAETRTSLATMARLRTLEDGWALAKSYDEDAKDYCPGCATKARGDSATGEPEACLGPTLNDARTAFSDATWRALHKALV